MGMETSTAVPDGTDGTVRLVRTSLGQTLLLDRPRRRNALTLAMWQRLGELVREVGAGTGEPLYLTGAGGYFCSGADLDALRHARSGAAEAQEFVSAVVSCLLSIHAVEREVVAVVEGGAAGGGVEIMAACDRRVAVGAPSLVFPFGTHGMRLDGFTRWRLHRLVGDQEAERLVDGRHVVDVKDAERLGLVDERHETLAAFAAAERTHVRRGREEQRSPVPQGVAEDRYLAGLDELPAATARAAVPMLRAFPPHRTPPVGDPMHDPHR